MGRNLTVIVLNGEYRVAKFCETDKPPIEQGRTLAEFISSNRFDLPTLKQRVREHRLINYDDSGMGWTEADSAADMWLPYRCRIFGAEIVEMIQNGEAPESKNDLAFASEFIFCEFVYVVDLDEETVEIYKGFNTTPLSVKDRFFFLVGESEDRYRESYPVRLLKAFPFKEFTQEALLRLENEMPEAFERTIRAVINKPPADSNWGE